MTVSYPLNTVVVGCDDSWQSHAAVEAATLEAGRRHCSLVVLSVARADGLRGGLAAMRAWEQDAVAAATATAKRAAARANDTDGTVPVQIVVAGSVDDAQVADAARRADLLVVGGYGSRGQAAFSLGTISGELVRRFGTPVLVPRRERATAPGSWHDRPPEVLVGISPARGATQPLRAAARQALLRGWSLAVVHTVPTTHPGQRLHHEQQAVWDAVRAVPECASVPCRVEVVQEATVAALVSRCGPRDLLVVSTRGGGTLAGLIAGSVARGVLDASVGDVMVVPALAGTSPGDVADDSANVLVGVLEEAPRGVRSTW
ncbi:MAG TPA: universal stress protein [Pedococcus sp.]|jgi:nucleotide-binding universal stress UspA family protein|nr:universal stress protein [Pedococcus sp.]